MSPEVVSAVPEPSLADARAASSPAQSNIRLRAFAIALLLALLVPASRAVAAHGSQDAEKTRTATEAYQEGQVAFNLGQWDKAIDAWQRGYAAKPDPVFLYNIGQAYRQKNDLEHSLFFYKSYLRNAPNAPNRAEVTSRIEELDKAVTAQKQAEAAANQRKAEEEQRKVEEQRRLLEELQRARDEAARAATVHPAVVVKPRELRGDLGIAAGANLWVAGLRDAGIKPGAAVELSGGYTVVRRSRVAFRIGATAAFTYLKDLSSTVNFFGFLADPTLKINLWKQRLFFDVQVGLGAAVMTGTSSTKSSYVTDSSTRGAKGTFVMFEARPAVGIEYLVIPRLSLLLSPGAAITPPYADHVSTQTRVQILAGVLVHL